MPSLLRAPAGFRFGSIAWSTVVFGLLSGLPAGPLLAQKPATHPWQHLQDPTAAEVQHTWRTPPAEYGPEPYYGLNGPVTLASVEHDLDTMKTLGFRAVTVQYGYGSGLAYLSPEYLSFFRQFVLQAKQRGMRVWIVDDAGYPSGFAGGKFTTEHPELRMQALVASSRTPLSAGGSFDQVVPPNTVAVTAIRSDGQQTVQIPFDHGAAQAHWTAPAEGSWTVYVVEHAFRTSPTRSDTNPKRVKDGSQSLEDYLDPAATAQFLTFTHEAYKRVVGDEFGKTILGFRGDEPDYSISGVPWTPAFFARFEQIKGYDIRPFAAAFLQSKEAVLTGEQQRARADYYDVFSQLFRDGFFKPQGEWCAANGLEYQVHLNHEEQEIALAHSEGDFFRDMRYVEVPGIDTIWHQISTDTVSDFPRLASSAAHVYGHPRAFTESFAAYRPLPDITMARYILNEQMVRGINLVETMYFPASSTPGRGGPMAFMLDPGYPALMQSVSRLSYLMAMGRPAASVALLLPAEALWMGDTKADDTFVSTERMLSEHQIDFDIVDEDAIGSLLKTAPGTFLSESGNHYRTVLVPRAHLLPVAVIDRLHAFATGGGKVVFLGKAPTLIGMRNDLHARTAAPAEFSWATVVPAELAATPTPPAQPPAAPPEPLVVPAPLLSAVQAAAGVAALALEKPDTSLRYTKRRLKDATVYLLFNESAKPIEDELILRASGRKLELWDPETGNVDPVPGVNARRGGLRLVLSLPPYTARVLVAR
jgi:hypothetical protein